MRQLKDLDAVPAFGSWFDSLVALMSEGNPPVMEFAPGDAIMRAGDPAEFFLVILHGQAEVVGTFGDNPGLAVEPGALLGELGVLFSGRRRRTVVATSSVIAITGTRAELEQAQQVEEIGNHVASIAGKRLAERVEPLEVTTGKGFTTVVRPLLPEDRDMYLELFGQVSLQTLYRRFFIARKPADSVIERLLYIDYIDHFAWVAIDPSAPAEPLIGIFRLVVEVDDSSAAEVAFTVVDGYQGRGLGTLFLGLTGAWAQVRRLRTLTAHVLNENESAKRLFGKAHAQWTGLDSGVRDARIAVDDAAALLDDQTIQRVAIANQQLAEVAALADA